LTCWDGFFRFRAAAAVLEDEEDEVERVEDGVVGEAETGETGDGEAAVAALAAEAAWTDAAGGDALGCPFDRLGGRGAVAAGMAGGEARGCRPAAAVGCDIALPATDDLTAAPTPLRAMPPTSTGVRAPFGRTERTDVGRAAAAAAEACCSFFALSMAILAFRDCSPLNMTEDRSR